jgi:hypothetical protein
MRTTHLGHTPRDVAMAAHAALVVPLPVRLAIGGCVICLCMCVGTTRSTAGTRVASAVGARRPRQAARRAAQCEQAARASTQRVPCAHTGAVGLPAVQCDGSARRWCCSCAGNWFVPVCLGTRVMLTCVAGRQGAEANQGSWAQRRCSAAQSAVWRRGCVWHTSARNNSSDCAVLVRRTEHWRDVWSGDGIVWVRLAWHEHARHVWHAAACSTATQLVWCAACVIVWRTASEFLVWLVVVCAAEQADFDRRRIRAYHTEQ